MNELTTQSVQLPDNIEDLTQFVLVGKAKLQAYMLKLQTVNKLSVAQEIRDQTLKEAQEISTAVIAAEQRIGEILLEIPKASGKRTDLETSAERAAKVKTKAETIAEQGYDRHEAHDYQQMAKHPEIIQRVIDDAIANGDVVTKSQVLKEIRAAKEEAKAEAEANRSTREKFEKSRADRLMAENEQLKSKVTDLEGSNWSLKHDLAESQSSQPEVVEVEVPPADYEALKKQAVTSKLAYNELMAKYTKKCNEALALKDKVSELKSVTQEGLENGNLSENVFYFCTIANNFVGNAGGLVWLTARIDDMGEKERDLFLKASEALVSFSTTFAENLRRRSS